MPVEGRDLSSRRTQDVVRDLEIGQPINSEECSDVAGMLRGKTDDRGRTTRTTEARDKLRGIPQGSPLSPLLANLYMRRFVLGWKMFGLERALGARLVTYADDLVILCRKGKAEEALL